MLKVIIVLLLIAIIISLFSGLFFLMKDDGKSTRVLNSLAVRVGLSAVLIIVVSIALYTGELSFNVSPLAYQNP